MNAEQFLILRSDIAKATEIICNCLAWVIILGVVQAIILGLIAWRIFSPTVS